MRNNEEQSQSPQRLLEHLCEIEDYRIDRTRDHKLIDILVIGLCSMITVGENFTDMEVFGKAKLKWLKTFLELPSGIPSHDTFNRVFSSINPEHFLECFVSWVRELCPSMQNEVVAIDGKALRRSLNTGETIPYIVIAWATKNGVALGQVKVDEKSNEITAIPELLRMLQLEGCVVTIDAMGCQKKIAKEIIKAKADYVLSLKGNHATIHEEIRDYFNDLIPPDVDKYDVFPEDMSFYETTDKGHGRIEIRRYWHTEDIHWFQDKKLWAGLNSIGMVESIRERGDEKSCERRFFLSSLHKDAKRFAEAVRGHWGVENPLHWSLDVTFGEDQSRARTKHAAQNLATLRRIALNTLKMEVSKKIPLRRKKMVAALDDSYLETILGLF